MQKKIKSLVDNLDYFPGMAFYSSNYSFLWNHTFLGRF